MLPPHARPLQRGDVAEAAGLLHGATPTVSIVATMKQLERTAAEGTSFVVRRSDRLTGIAVVERVGASATIRHLAGRDAASVGVLVDALSRTHSELDFLCPRHHAWRRELVRGHRFEPVAEEVEVEATPAERLGGVCLRPAEPDVVQALTRDVLRETAHRRLARRGPPGGDASSDFVACVGDEPVGVALLEVEDGVGAARLLGIRPDLRGRGLGTALVGAVLTKLRDLGCDRYEDATDVQNVAMRRAFAASGCVERSLCEWLVRTS